MFGSREGLAKPADPSSTTDTITVVAQSSAPSDPALRPWPRCGIAAAALTVVSLIAIGGLAVADTARVTSHDALRSVGFGRPFNWLIQDQTSLDPPSYPRDQPLVSPWEHSVTVDLVPLLMNVALTVGVLIGFWMAICGWHLGARRKPGQRTRISRSGGQVLAKADGVTLTLGGFAPTRHGGTSSVAQRGPRRLRSLRDGWRHFRR
jgi:hypothetical protein